MGGIVPSYTGTRHFLARTFGRDGNVYSSWILYSTTCIEGFTPSWLYGRELEEIWYWNGNGRFITLLCCAVLCCAVLCCAFNDV
jgi:hypothetical protein